VRTSNPTQYWLLSSGRVENPMLGDPMRVVIAGSSSSISAGGLIFNTKPWVGVGLAAFVFSLLFWFPLVRGITRTIGRMMQATRQIADGQFDVRLKIRRADELGTLGESIDQMAARLDGLVQGQKRFLGDIAHELCSPLARMQMALGVMEQRATPDQAPYLRSASEKAEQIAALVGELLSFSKASFGASALRLEPVNLLQIARKAAEAEKTEASQIEVKIPADLRVAADAELLTRALANLIRNGIQHAGAGNTISMQAARSGEEVTLTVSDSGPGVPEDELPKIFDAFYRLDASRTRGTGGTGLGLAIVKTCIESCCGSVAARNREPHGLQIVIRLREASEGSGSQSLNRAASVARDDAQLGMGDPETKKGPPEVGKTDVRPA
jgi:two-component system sensor histidine kinase CpxA